MQRKVESPVPLEAIMRLDPGDY
ncbi:hypothetical protein E2C01_093997 [Portunus trituberculatus]|uniref:Uncharacterized protein n=1 Tax=Portunus trituberculatus TaxID=210409 RepID=A0A5B7JW21_PORTR|nr:hypothetical protein [Portunus trituberculatus]